MSSERMPVPPMPVPLLPGAASAGPERGRAQARGYAAGYAAGLHAAAERAAAEEAQRQERRLRAAEDDTQRRRSALTALASAEHAVRERADELATDVEREIVRYAVELAEALIGRELREAGAAARAALGRVQAALPIGSIVAVRLHPSDVELVSGEAAERGIPLTADAALIPGDAVAELDEGWLDARLSAALARVTAVLRGEAEAES